MLTFELRSFAEWYKKKAEVIFLLLLFHCAPLLISTVMTSWRDRQEMEGMLLHAARSLVELSTSLVSEVVECSPQLYVKSKLRLLNQLGKLVEELLELNQDWTELKLELERDGVTWKEPQDERALLKRSATSDGAREPISPPTKRPRST